MVAIKGHFDGKVIVPDEPVDLPRNQTLILHIEQETATGAGIDLSSRGIGSEQAADLRSRLKAFESDWQRPEMSAYDER